MTTTRVVLLIAVAFVFLVALVSLGIFERIPHVEDEAAYWFQAQVFAQGQLSVPTPAHRLSYWSPFVIDLDGQRFGKYPPGFPLLLSLGMLAGMPWAVNAVLGSLSLVLLADLGRKIYSPTVGLVAAALGLTCPALLVAASSLLSHAASIFLVTLFMDAFVRMDAACQSAGSPIQRDRAVVRRWMWAILAGLAVGFLFITRPYDAIGVGLPFAACLLTRLTRQSRRDWLAPGVALVAVAGLVAVMLPLYWYLLSGHPFYDPYLAVFPYDRPGFGPQVGNGGYTLADAWFNLKCNLERMAAGFLGWPWITNVILAGVPFASGVAYVLGRRLTTMTPCGSQSASGGEDVRRFPPFHCAGKRLVGEGGVRYAICTWDVLLPATFASVALLYTTYWFYGGHDGGFPRYWLPALPALLLLTARGVDITAVTLRRLGARLTHTVLRGVPLALFYMTIAGLVAYNAFIFLPPELATFHRRYGVTAAPLEVARRAGIRHALVFVEGVQHWNDFAAFFAANSPMLDSNVVYAAYRDPVQAKSVRALFSERECYVQRGDRLDVCVAF
jgi:4-amino-4-deoxy-L-arabinose transferase-like glycosyltransferase